MLQAHPPVLERGHDGSTVRASRRRCRATGLLAGRGANGLGARLRVGRKASVTGWSPWMPTAYRSTRWRPPRSRPSGCTAAVGAGPAAGGSSDEVEGRSRARRRGRCGTRALDRRLPRRPRSACERRHARRRGAGADRFGPARCGGAGPRLARPRRSGRVPARPCVLRGADPDADRAGRRRGRDSRPGDGRRRLPDQAGAPARAARPAAGAAAARRVGCRRDGSVARGRARDRPRASRGLARRRAARAHHPGSSTC